MKFGSYCVQVFSFTTPANNVVICGVNNADRNLIVPGGASGTFGIGIQLPYISPGPGTGYLIQGNYIGTDIAGKIALSHGNALDAISNATVMDNLISENPGGAIQLLDDHAADATGGCHSRAHARRVGDPVADYLVGRIREHAYQSASSTEVKSGDTLPGTRADELALADIDP